MTDQPWMSSHTEMVPEDLFDHVFMFIHAPEGAGKSTLALTISDMCPEPWPPVGLKERVWLDDIFYIAVDSKAIAGMYSMNVVPRYVFDLDKLITDEATWKAAKFPARPPMSAAAEFALDKAEEWLKKNPNGKIVVDTLSTLNAGLLVEFTDKNPKRMYGEALNWHRVFHYRLKYMPFKACVYLAHSKALWMANDETLQSQMAKEAGKALDDAEIVPDISGQAVQIYQREAIFVGTIDVVTPPGGKGRKRYLYLEKVNGKGGKNRFEHIVKGKQEPHLKKLLEQIKQASK